MKRSNLFLAAVLLGLVLFVVSCATGKERAAAAKGELFSLTNALMDDEPVQVVKSTFGLGITPRRSDVTVRFGTNGSILVTFNRVTLRPEQILLTIPGADGQPGQSVCDLNADGMPDMRKIEGEEQKQIYYLGDWCYYEPAGTNVIIIREGKPLRVFFDGKAWRKAPDEPKSSPKKPDPPMVGIR